MDSFTSKDPGPVPKERSIPRTLRNNIIRSKGRRAVWCTKTLCAYKLLMTKSSGCVISNTLSRLLMIKFPQLLCVK